MKVFAIFTSLLFLFSSNSFGLSTDDKFCLALKAIESSGGTPDQMCRSLQRVAGGSAGANCLQATRYSHAICIGLSTSSARCRDVRTVAGALCGIVDGFSSCRSVDMGSQQVKAVGEAVCSFANMPRLCDVNHAYQAVSRECGLSGTWSRFSSRLHGIN